MFSDDECKTKILIVFSVFFSGLCFKVSQIVILMRFMHSNDTKMIKNYKNDQREENIRSNFI